MVAVADWTAVARDDRRLRRVTKPATLVLLIGVALTLDVDEPAVRAWFLAGLALSLAGDVFLLLPEDRRIGPVEPFLLGLGAFLVGHLAYVVGMVVDRRSIAMSVVGVALVAVVATVVAPRILAGAARTAPALRLPVMGYMAVISLMVVAAFGRGVAVGIVGALLFYASDATLGWNRFVAPSRVAAVVVIVTYHLGQAALVLSLLG